MGLYETVLDNLGEGASLPAPRPPRASAAVVPWRYTERAGGATALEVYWVRRSDAVPFMAGWHAFPGGGLSRSDANIAVEGLPSGVAESPEDGAMPPAVTDGVELGPILRPGLMVCALRELFEEVGLLPGAEHVEPSAMAAARRALLAEETSFEAVLERFDIVPSAAGLSYAGRWLTPPLGPLRFDNRFFLLDLSGAPVQPEIVPGELASGEWIEPAEALERWRRGDVITAPPILHILRVLAAAGPEWSSEESDDSSLRRLRAPHEANLGSHRTVEFRPGVLLFALPTPTLPPATHTNSYLLGTEEAVLVDPGSPYASEIERLVEALAEAERRLGRRTTQIWLTHHHPDHVGGVLALQQALGVPVRAHPATVEHLAASTVEFGEALIDGDLVVLPGATHEMEIEVLHTPGHARGHLCFFERREGWLIGGDMVSGVGMIVIDPPEGDMDAYLGSLERLERLGATTLFPAHGPTSAQPSARFKHYREHRLWREAKILEAWRAGTREPSDMLPTVYADVPPIAHPLAVRQILAHLARLESRGEIGPPTPD